MTVTDVNTETGREPLRSIPFRIIGSVASANVLQALNSSMIAVGIVGIALQFGSSTGVSWVISGLYMATAVIAPLAGRLSSIVGARRVYLGGLVIVALGSVAGMFAPGIWWLVAAYVLIGAGTACQLPSAMTIIRGYAESYNREPYTAISVLVLCGQATAALGPTLGGLLTGAFGWQSIMWINLPVAAISACVVLRFVDPAPAAVPPVARRELLRSLDIGGVALFVVMVIATLLFLLSLTGDPMWWLIPVWVLTVGLFIVRERRAEDPFIDVRALVRNQALSATLGRTLLTYTAFYCIFFGIPQWLQYGYGMTAIEAGLTMLPVAVVGMVSTMLASAIIKRYGVRLTLLVGTAALTIGGVLLATVEDSASPLVVLLLVAAVLGIPNGFNNIGNQNLVNSVTTVSEVGTAMGMYKTVQFVGANLAVVVLQITAGPVITDDGLHRAGWFISAVGVVLIIGIALSRNMGTKTVARQR